MALQAWEKDKESVLWLKAISPETLVTTCSPSKNNTTQPGCSLSHSLHQTITLLICSAYLFSTLPVSLPLSANMHVGPKELMSVLAIPPIKDVTGTTPQKGINNNITLELSFLYPQTSLPSFL